MSVHNILRSKLIAIRGLQPQTPQEAMSTRDLSSARDLSSITESRHQAELQGDDGGLSIPALPTLYGRSTESAALLQTYERIAQNRTAEICVVHGKPGTGKTSLVDSLRQTVCDGGGYFCAGKYFQDTHEPYSAITAAFSDLCDLVRQSEGDRRRNIIQEALGVDGHLLSKLITNLSYFLADQSSQGPAHVRTDAALVKFKATCKTFLHAMSSKEHPILIFLDDIQWMDTGSRQLIEMFIRDKDLAHVMLIFSHRDGRVDILQNLFPKDCLHIPLTNLDSTAVFQMICGMMGDCETSEEDKTELVELVMKKTSGNPFHVVHFFQEILNEQMLAYEGSTSSWQFDVHKIQREILIPDTLADLLEKKIAHIPPEERELLKLASIVGFEFTERILIDVCHGLKLQQNGKLKYLRSYTQSDMRVMLKEAVAYGFVEATKAGFQFSHDALQSSCQSLCDDEERKLLHLVIGEAFCTYETDEANYHAAVHLNRARDHFQKDNKRRLRLSRINLEASKYCREISAFEIAAVLLRVGLELIDEKVKWTRYSEMTLEMTISLAKMELIVGHFDTCNDLMREALQHSESTDVKIDLLLLDVEVQMAENKIDQSIKAAKNALGVLGIDMPRNISMRHIPFKLWKVRKSVRRLSDEDIMSLPPMQNPETRSAVKLLSELSLFCLLRDDSPPAVFSALLAIELTFKYGLSQGSALAMTIYGIVELSLGQHGRSYRFGKLAIELLKIGKCRASECATLALGISSLAHWIDPVRDLHDPLLRGLESGFATGDMVHSAFCIADYFGICVLLGVNLKELEDIMWVHYRRISDLGQETMLLWAQPAIQFVINMQSRSDDRDALSKLTGEVMNNDDFVRQARASNNKILEVVAMMFEAQLSYFLGYDEAAELIYKDMDKIGDVFRYSYAVLPYLFFGAMTHYERYRNTDARKHLKAARKYKKELEKIASLGGPNASPFIALLCAEELAFTKATAAMLSVAYNRAISVLAADRWVHMEALANERAGFVFAELGEGVDAETYFDRALHLYQNGWGAIAKYQYLREQKAVALSRASGVWTNPAAALLDCTIYASTSYNPNHSGKGDTEGSRL